MYCSTVWGRARSALRQSALVTWNAPSPAPGLQKHPVRMEIPAAAAPAGHAESVEAAEPAAA